MGINYKALKDYEPGGGKGVSEWFKPKPGDDGKERQYSVRIVLPNGMDFPFFDSQIHYFRWKDGFTSGACPRMKGEYCPACDIFFTLRQHPEFGTDSGKQLLRKLSPTTRIYANVVVRGTDRVQVWSMPYSFAQDLKNQILVYLEDGVDLTDPSKGHDLSFVVSKTGAVQKYGGITVRPRPSDLGVDDWQAQCHNLEAKAHTRMFNTEEVEEHIEKVLGDEAASMVELFKTLKEEQKPTADPEEGEIGEAV